VAIIAAVGIMGVRVWALLLATVRGTYWREGLETGYGEVRTGDRAL
jgi:hypothetical protein